MGYWYVYQFVFILIVQLVKRDIVLLRVRMIFLLLFYYRYYRGAVGALMVYDITSRSSFENVEGWLSELRQHSESDMVVILVRLKIKNNSQIGNKCDLANQRCISTEEAVAYAEKHNMAFLETSAYDKTGIDEAFTMVLSRIILY